jgi:hypothetical protein
MEAQSGNAGALGVYLIQWRRPVIVFGIMTMSSSIWVCKEASGGCAELGVIEGGNEDFGEEDWDGMGIDIIVK